MNENWTLITLRCWQQAGILYASGSRQLPCWPSCWQSAPVCVCVWARVCVCVACVCAKRECTCCTGKYHQRGNNQGANAKREKIAHKPGQYNVGTQIQQTRTVSCGLVLRRYSTLHHRKQTCRPQCEDEKYLCADGAGKRTSEHCIEMLHTKTRSNISFILPSAVRGPHLERYRSGPRQWLACSTRQGVRIRATVRG